MKVALVMVLDVADEMIDHGSPTGVTAAGLDMINDALYNLGSNVEVRRLAVACDHPNTEVDGEYLRCSDCKTIVGRS
jgi:hypothetical protein